ncbi:hypothetical protein KAR91_78415 [Candidatus Pacearchaeota archaeon]|nr:hypothetical protein [Candidatus Pacearchaeota archaeon]
MNKLCDHGPNSPGCFYCAGKKREVSAVASNDRLYDISVDVNMKINWLEPVKSANENIARDHKQNLLDEKAHQFSQEIRRRLKEHGI